MKQQDYLKLLEKHKKQGASTSCGLALCHQVILRSLEAPLKLSFKMASGYPQCVPLLLLISGEEEADLLTPHSWVDQQRQL